MYVYIYYTYKYLCIQHSIDYMRVNSTLHAAGLLASPRGHLCGILLFPGGIILFSEPLKRGTTGIRLTPQSLVPKCSGFHG